MWLGVSIYYKQKMYLRYLLVAVRKLLLNLAHMLKFVDTLIKFIYIIIKEWGSDESSCLWGGVLHDFNPKNICEAGYSF